MLILSRRAGESVVIDSNIEVIVTEIRGNQVRLGFVAPNDVPIHRSEIHKRVLAERTATITLPCAPDSVRDAAAV